MSEIKVQGSGGWYSFVPTSDIIAALKAAPAPVKEEIGVSVYDLPKAIEDVRVRKLEEEIIATRGQRDSARLLAIRAEEALDTLRERVRTADGERDAARAASLAAQNRHIVAERERNEARDERDRLQRELAEARAPKPSADLPLAPGSRWVDGEVVDAYSNRTRIMGNPGREWLRTIDRDDKRGSPYVADAIAVLAKAGLLPPGSPQPRRWHSPRELKWLRELDEDTYYWHLCCPETRAEIPIAMLCKAIDEAPEEVRSGLLPAGDGVPRERVMEMLVRAWIVGSEHHHARSIPFGDYASIRKSDVGRIFADYDREKGDK